MKTASQVRASFLDFFKGKGHEVCASAPLVPENDPTLMFTNAGMVPFKDVFTGKDKRPYTRATSSQKCIRISGKHNDLENVGVTARHHTFFEMLGNFSFGDYFKEEAIAYAWELLTGVWQLPRERIVISVFGGEGGIPADVEARALWEKIAGVPVIDLGMKDNFWSMGDTGPCGPCTELHFWTGDGPPDLGKFTEEPSPDGKGWMELWNLVFMQFERREKAKDTEGALEPLPKPCVDTGAGLERVASVLQGKTSNYDTDLLRALVEKAASIAGKPYRATQADDDVSMRVIADHGRLTAFLISENITPANGDREYVLRRVMRRAIRHGDRLGIRRPFLHEVAGAVVELMGDQYPQLVERRAFISDTTEREEMIFRTTLERGLRLLDEEISSVKACGGSVIPGEAAFRLYDTYGFPKDLTQVVARERGLDVDMHRFDELMDEQKRRGKGSKVGDDAVEEVWRDAHATVPPGGVRFVGYEREEAEGKVLFVAKVGEETAVVTDVTPFYGEAGGQVGDKGRIGDFVVTDTQKPLAGLVVHLGEGPAPAVGATVKLTVDHALRTATRRNHSATHLLHWALRKVVGETATQKGSLVGPDRLRFDYSSGRALSGDEMRQIEDLVNEKILLDAPVQTEVLPIEEAKKRGAMAIFEEKYGDVVRVLTMTKDSVELCGGTHARALGEIGMFKILGDVGIAAGVRRIEAATGMNALAYVRSIESTVKGAARLVKAGPNDLPEKIEHVLEQTKRLEKELAETKRKLAMGGSGGGAGGDGGGGGLDALAAKARALSFGKALSVRVDVDDAAMLREMAEKLRDKLGDAVVLVGAAPPGAAKAMLVCTVSKSLTDRFKAGDLIRPVAQILGGSGGGRPDMAQAGGTDVGKLDEALEKLYALVS
jgi:alanyl-tRNA synthetase